MKYTVKCHSNSTINWEAVPSAEINNSEWTGISASELSKTYAKAFFTADGAESGLTVRLYCHEESPRTNITENDGAVYTDSCLEFFCNFLPHKSDKYINFEINSNGVLHCAIGSGRNGRVFARKIVKEELMPKPVSIKTEEYWCVEFTVSQDFVREIYGINETFGIGSEIKGNFYKSGECCEPMHFLTWSLVETEAPDYHRPEYFGTLIIE